MEQGSIEKFTGLRVSSLAEYVALVQSVRSKGITRTLLTFNLQLDEFIEAAHRWFNILARDELLAQEFTEKISVFQGEKSQDTVSSFKLKGVLIRRCL